MDLIDIYRAINLKTAEYTFFSSARGTFFRTDHRVGHKVNFGNFKKIEIISSKFSDHYAMRLREDCLHEIKRHFLLGRKADKPRQHIKKQRHVTLPTKVHLVKPMVFPVVMFGCEHWTTNELWC